MSSHEVSEKTVTKYGGLGSIFVHPPCGWVRNSDPSDQISQRVPSGSTLTVGCHRGGAALDAPACGWRQPSITKNVSGQADKKTT